MAEAQRMEVVLCWHMHQPEYRDLRSGQYQFPWTYLHAVKDYVDMAAHLEAHPGARAVVNFAPVLLEQIADYAAQLEDCLGRGSAIRDPLLAALAEPPMPASPDARSALMKQCLRANRQRIIERFPAYKRLAATAQWVQEHPGTMMYLSDQFLVDLIVWYHLGWMAETVRRADPRVQRLQDKTHGFTVHDRRQLLGILLDMLRSVVPRYRRLAEAGRVELAMSPYAHPILPLLLDIRAGAQTQPEAQLPLIDGYPGGRERARWHLRHGRDVFERHFGMTPSGCWPSEGALSDATLELLAEEGFRWSASGESVLRNSMGADDVLADAHAPGHACRHRVYRFGGNTVDCFFRDDGLSDLIGFTYSEWHAEDAVANLLHHLENIKAACVNCRDCAIVIILDGENAWEYYPENGYYFLDALYRELSRHPGFTLGTFSSFLDAREPRRAHLAALKAGSWVYGTLSTWLGNADKNRAWDLLCEVKQCADRALLGDRLDERERAAVLNRLAVCESSDWFWWLGDYNSPQSVACFDSLFRENLKSLYRLLRLPVPGSLDHPISIGGGTPEGGGTMRRAT